MSNRRTFEQLTERERMELAAKAAGVEIKAVVGETFWRSSGIPWSPLYDDADSFRLAVAIPSLNLQWVIAEAYQAADTEAMRLDYVRRAIFRVAVEFGSRMP